jgi:hypothetical protein
MHSRRTVFSVITLALLFFGASLGGGAAALASTATGAISMSWATAGAEQNLGVRLIAVNRRGGSLGAASTHCSTVNGTAVAGKDYTPVSSVVTWANGDSADKWCNVTISNATPFTGQKTFYVKLSNPTGAPLGTTVTTVVTIYGDKDGGLVSLSAPTYSVAQSAGSVTISVNRMSGSSGGASVNYATANGTAIAGTNYTSERGSLSWGNGDTAPKSFVIPISKAVPLTGAKTLAVAIAGSEGAALGTTTSAIVTISGSTATQPSVSMNASPTSVASGGSSTVNWSATNATACTASGAWSGSVATSGSQATGAMTATKTYTLNCTGAGGSATQSATVAVSAPVSPPTGLSCSGTSGPLTLRASTVRDVGISPLLVFFDATGTTDSSISGKTTAFQDVSYSWNFGDTGASGTGTWAYGANPGKNSRNTASGGVAAHLYVTPGADTAYVVTVTAHDGANTASCQLGVTAHDPAGANGFAGAKTTCVSASGTPTPGSGGCPAGAAALNTSSFNTALGSLSSGKRVLFKCGDTFTGDNATLSGTTWSVGAYGGCEGTQTNRPIFRDPTSGNAALEVALASGDGRIADIDFEGAGTGTAAVWTPGGNSKINYQITLYNLLSNGNNSAYGYSQGAQWGIVGSVMTGMRTSIGTFLNFNENNPTTWSGNVYNNLDYQALLGNSFNGAGAADNGSGLETVRLSACRMCVIENNTIENANNVGAVLKLHNGNTNNSLPTWTGVYTELLEISDNWFGGTSGANLIENAPQNGGDDERLRNIVFERNLISGSTGAQGGRQLLVSAVNETVRDNVFYMPGNSSQFAIYGVQVAQRGVEPVPSGVEVYNNTCYAPNGVTTQTCIGFTNVGSLRAPPINSFAKNNLFYIPASGHSTVVDTGTGNTVTNNTASPTSNPAFTDGSGSFSVISDFKPTANYLGGASVPVWSDALGVLWPTWDLGAVSP